MIVKPQARHAASLRGCCRRRLDQNEWTQALESVELQLTCAEAQLVFATLDTGNGGTIGINELIVRRE